MSAKLIEENRKLKRALDRSIKRHHEIRHDDTDDAPGCPTSYHSAQWSAE